MKRIIFLFAAVAAVTIALSGAAALAQEEGDRGGGDVCVSVKGDTKVDRGASECSSDETSHAVAVKNSEAIALEDSRATAVNDSFARAAFDSDARAVNDSQAGALRDCTATARNGEEVICP